MGAAEYIPGFEINDYNGDGKLDILAIDTTGNYIWINNTISDVHNVKQATLPETPILYQNYPNPFNPTTMINYQLPVTNHALIKVYDVLGREITTLVDTQLPAGRHQVLWDAGNYANGIYFYKIQAGDFQNMKKMLLIK